MKNDQWKKNQTEVRNDYMAIVRTHLDNARRSIATLVENLPCTELRDKQHNYKLHNCTPDVDFVNTLHHLNCKMKNLRLSHTEQLVTSVLNSILCPCSERPTKDPSLRSKRWRAVTRRRRNEQKINNRETKKLCKAMTIISVMTECYEMLNFSTS